MMALTREPSGRRASTIGEDSSTRRPTADTILSITCAVLDVVGEGEVGALDAAVALDPDVVVGVAHHLGDGVVGEQRVERPVAEGVGHHLLDEAAPLERRDLDVLALEDLVERALHLDGELLAGEALHPRGDLVEHELAHLASWWRPRCSWPRRARWRAARFGDAGGGRRAAGRPRRPRGSPPPRGRRASRRASSGPPRAWRSRPRPCSSGGTSPSSSGWCRRRRAACTLRRAARASCRRPSGG